MQHLRPPPSTIDFRQIDGRAICDFQPIRLRWYIVAFLFVGIVWLAACVQQWGALLGWWSGEVFDMPWKPRIVLTALPVILIGFSVLAMFGRQRIYLDSSAITKQLLIFGVPFIKLLIPWHTVSQVEVGADSDGDPVLRIRRNEGDSVIVEGFRTADEREWFRGVIEAYRKPIADSREP